MQSEHNSAKPGPDAERLKIEGDWEKAVKKAVGKKRPVKGWPKPPAKQKRLKKST